MGTGPFGSALEREDPATEAVGTALGLGDGRRADARTPVDGCDRQGVDPALALP